MKYQKYCLIALSLVGLSFFAIFRFPIELGTCLEIAKFQNGNTYCAVRPLLPSNYMWPIFEFSRAIFIVGILCVVKPTATKSLIILTFISASLVTMAVISAPDIRTNILSPFDKKFVGQLGAGIYFVIALITWGISVYRTRKQ